MLAEGWAAPLKGFMREGVLAQTLHFRSVLVNEGDVLYVTASEGAAQVKPDPHDNVAGVEVMRAGGAPT